LKTELIHVNGYIKNPLASTKSKDHKTNRVTIQAWKGRSW